MMVRIGRLAAVVTLRESKRLEVWARVSSPRTTQPKLLAGLATQACTSAMSPALDHEYAGDAGPPKDRNRRRGARAEILDGRPPASAVDGPAREHGGLPRRENARDRPHDVVEAIVHGVERRIPGRDHGVARGGRAEENREASLRAGRPERRRKKAAEG